MALDIKQVLVKSKIRRAKLRAIQKFLDGIPKTVTFEYYEEDYTVGYERSRSDLANELRKILSADPFAGNEGQRPGKVQENTSKLAKLAKYPSPFSGTKNLPQL